MAEIKRLRLVAGNKVTLIIPMQKVVFTQAGKTTENYYPPTGTEIGVTLQGQYRKYEFVPTIEENNIIFTDNGTLAVGEYAVVITVKEPDDTKRRSKWLMIVTVYDSNEPVVDEFDDFPDYAEGAIIEGSVFFFAKGDKGDPGEGVPEGGATGQVLRKKSNEDYDTEWADESVTSVNGKTGAVTLIAKDVKALPDSTTIPSKTSDLINNSGFITKTVDNLVNYYLKEETYTKDEVQQIVSAIKQFRYEVVPTLPDASAETMHCIYLVPSADPQAQNIKDEYITIQSDSQRDVYFWEQIGSTAIDLSGYYTSAETDSAISAALTAALADYTTTNDLTTLLAAKANANEMSVVDGTGTDADKTTITLKTGTSATVLKSHQSLAGKQDLIDSTHKLSADLVDDTNTTNKFVTASDKTTWDNKYTKPQTGIPASDIEAGVIPVIPSNTSYFSNYSGVGIVPEDGIRAETVTNAATMSINPDVLTLIDGTVGTATITLQVPNDSLAHVWDIMLTTDSTVNITLAMSNSATIKVPSGFAIGASADCEISVIGKGTKYYLRYGEFA